jgi:hypothetical protein
LDLRRWKPLSTARSNLPDEPDPTTELNTRSLHGDRPSPPTFVTPVAAVDRSTHEQAAGNKSWSSQRQGDLHRTAVKAQVRPVLIAGFVARCRA